MGLKATTQELVKLLDLQPHPEGGFYKEGFRDTDITLSAHSLPSQYKVDRPVSTAIYFLLPTRTVSCLHRIPNSEVWHFYSGDPLTVFEIDDDGKMNHTVLGQDLAAGQKVQYVTRPMVWFGAYPTKDITLLPKEGHPLVKAPERDQETSYSLVGCTCAPGFEFDDFELAERAALMAKYPHAQTFIEYLTHSS